MTKNNVTIVYDGECPFCSDFVSLNRLKEHGYNVKLVNARDTSNQLVHDLKKKYNIDYGMIVIVNEKILYGSSAARFISSSYKKNNLKSLVYCLVLFNQKIADFSYPILVFLRKIYFRLTGKRFINDDK